MPWLFEVMVERRKGGHLEQGKYDRASGEPGGAPTGRKAKRLRKPSRAQPFGFGFEMKRLRGRGLAERVCAAELQYEAERLKLHP